MSNFSFISLISFVLVSVCFLKSLTCFEITGVFYSYRGGISCLGLFHKSSTGLLTGADATTDSGDLFASISRGSFSPSSQWVRRVGGRAGGMGAGADATTDSGDLFASISRGSFSPSSQWVRR